MEYQTQADDARDNTPAASIIGRQSLRYSSTQAQTLAASDETLLQSIARRIHEYGAHAHQTAGLLRDHADSAFGSEIEPASKDGPRPCRIGQFGLIDDALDDLDRALAELSKQAARNCNLA